MKKYIVSGLFIIIAISYSCNHKVDGLALADEVCECKMKTKGMKYADPERKRIWKECSELQGKNWMKIVRDKMQEDAFNKRLNECMGKLTIGE